MIVIIRNIIQLSSKKYKNFKLCIVFRNIKNKIQVVEELPKVEELEASDNIVGASFSTIVATPFLAIASVASATIPTTCVAVELVRVWWGGGMGKRKQIVDLGFETEEARREGGRRDAAERRQRSLRVLEFYF